MQRGRREVLSRQSLKLAGASREAAPDIAPVLFRLDDEHDVARLSPRFTPYSAVVNALAKARQIKNQWIGARSCRCDGLHTDGPITGRIDPGVPRGSCRKAVARRIAASRIFLQKVLGLG